ncbi:hypothetical protein M758_UG281600 [Ceratodon purpureus]|nr:hypothetical protein M758_UG281600 [Ceratodon purpureus]
MPTRARVAMPTRRQQTTKKIQLVIRVVNDQTESANNRTETRNKNSQHSKSIATTKSKQQVEQEKLNWLKEKEALELLVTKKDDWVIQYQTSSEQILKAKTKWRRSCSKKFPNL